MIHGLASFIIPWLCMLLSSKTNLFKKYECMTA